MPWSDRDILTVIHHLLCTRMDYLPTYRGEFMEDRAVSGVNDLVLCPALDIDFEWGPIPDVFVDDADEQFELCTLFVATGGSSGGGRTAKSLAQRPHIQEEHEGLWSPEGSAERFEVGTSHQVRIENLQEVKYSRLLAQGAAGFSDDIRVPWFERLVGISRKTSDAEAGRNHARSTWRTRILSTRRFHTSIRRMYPWEIISAPRYVLPPLEVNIETFLRLDDAQPHLDAEGLLAVVLKDLKERGEVQYRI